MSKKLVIVESPTKARTINRFLRGEAEVMASMGHVRDLPDGDIGVDIAHGFKPTYRLTPGGAKIVGKLKAAAAAASDIYLATDPDREGEAIAWHLQEVLGGVSKGVFHRVSFHEITQSAIAKAFAESAAVDMNRVDAQQARRILDRLVGYKISPLLWKNIKRGTSAGRVQSVALRLIAERERKIQGFTPEEYWTMSATFLPDLPPTAFETRLFKLDGDKPEIGDADLARELAEELETAAFAVAGSGTRMKAQRPAPPFITSTLQQAAGGRLRFSARQTMQVAQQLYEGVELGSGGAVGLITYMRTDSVAIAKEAQESARAYIAETFGPDYVPAKPNVYKSRQSAQGAHEAIRPTDVNRTPQAVSPYLDARQLKLYTLVWNRFVASQMAPAQLKEHSVEVKALPGGSGKPGSLAHDYLFRATATQTVFPGFTRVYGTGANEEDEAANPDGTILPEVKTGTPCQLQGLEKEQKFTEPPRRFSEASLVRELEDNGVGRPSTYASIIHTIQQREYVHKEKGALLPTDLGFSVNDYLVANMPDLFDIGFTASMEKQLDEIENGNVGFSEMLEGFYDNFRKWVVDVEMIHAPKKDACADFLAVFPPDLAWDPPEKRGRQIRDDGKFFTSIKTQMESGKKLSDRQWIAVLCLAAKYADRLTNLQPVLDELGMADAFEAAQTAERQRRKAVKAREQRDEEPPSERAVELLAGLRNVDWAPPEKRGKRVYDDHKFFASLNERVQDNKPLTEPQEKALIRLALKYRGQISGFGELAEKHGIAAAEEAGDGQQTEATSRLLALFDRIAEWQPPRTMGRKSYDDRDFATSIVTQFNNKRTLSDRQVAAVKKMLSRYHAQLGDYAALQEEFGLPATTRAGAPAADKEGRTAAQTVDEKCPECGKNLVVRNGKRGPFLGCSGYPKCRHTKQMAPASA